GYSMLLVRAGDGIGLPAGYVDALHLLERGANAQYAAPDGTTLATLLAKHRRSYAQDNRPIPEEFNALCTWLQAHGVTVPAANE
ncbi:MAG: hypothetical protein JO117_03445, partial [Verrucomicrobia bacterium]|nr:hypothetical protein [Verrucomicrobiota bacterium]